MRVLEFTAFLIVALWADLIKASAVGHNAIHKSRHSSRRSVLEAPQNITERALERRFDNARFTFFDTGLGACGTVNSPGDFIVALNSAQYNGGSHCYQMITITVGSKSHSAQIVDECPGCPFGGLDFSTGLFDFFASESVGVLTGSWNFGGSAAPAKPPPPPPPKTTHHPPPPPPPPAPKTTHTTVHHDPPTTTSPKPKPTSSADPIIVAHASPSPSPSVFKSESVSASPSPSANASASAVPSQTPAVPNVSPLASPAASVGNLALLYLNAVQMGSLIVAGNSTAPNGT